VLYRLPKVIEAGKNGGTIWLCEGEKDVHALERAGAVGTTSPGGAGKWRDEYAEFLRGADVVIVADRDEPGRRHATAVAASLVGIAKSVRTVQSATTREKDDISDHLDAGHTLADLVPIDDTQAPGPGGLSRAGELRGALLDSAALDQLPDPEPLIDGILYRDSLAWLHGKPGHGKSFVALDWAACVSTGLPWQMHGTTQGQVLYVIAEGVSGLRQRVRAWEDHTRAGAGVTFLPVAVQLLNHADVEALITVASDLEPVFIVVDTQARVTVGGDENSAKDMGELVAAADRIRRATRACILLVHHEARNGDNLRGSTALEGAATTLARVAKDGPHITVENTKQKDAPEFDRIRLWLTPRLESAVLSSHEPVGLTGEYTDSEQKIIDTLRDSFGTTGAPGGKLSDVVAVPKSSYYRALNRLVSTGAIANIGTRKRPHYLLPEHLAVPQSHLVPPSPTETPVPSPKSHHPFRGGTSGTETPAEPASTEPDQ
jgi:5S rRNA maturation endonuclease (ribonuclease M5)